MHIVISPHQRHRVCVCMRTESCLVLRTSITSTFSSPVCCGASRCSRSARASRAARLLIHEVNKARRARVLRTTRGRRERLDRRRGRPLRRPPLRRSMHELSRRRMVHLPRAAAARPSRGGEVCQRRSRSRGGETHARVATRRRWTRDWRREVGKVPEIVAEEVLLLRGFWLRRTRRRCQRWNREGRRELDGVLHLRWGEVFRHASLRHTDLRRGRLPCLAGRAVALLPVGWGHRGLGRRCWGGALDPRGRGWSCGCGGRGERREVAKVAKIVVARGEGSETRLLGGGGSWSTEVPKVPEIAKVVVGGLC